MAKDERSTKNMFYSLAALCLILFALYNLIKMIVNPKQKTAENNARFFAPDNNIAQENMDFKRSLSSSPSPRNPNVNQESNYTQLSASHHQDADIDGLIEDLKRLRISSPSTSRSHAPQRP